MTIALPTQSKQWVIIGTAFFVVHLICYAVYHSRPLDDAEHYVNAGALFLSEGKIDAHFHVLYAVPIVLLALFTWLFGDPVFGYITFQVITSALAVIALYSITNAVSSQTAAFLAAMMFVLWIDNIRWNVLIMTESLFGSITIFLFARFLADERERHHTWQCVVLLAISVFTRPVGLLLAIAVIVSVVVDYQKRHSVSAVKVAGFVLVACCCVLTVAYYLSLNWDFTDQYFRGNVITYADTYAGDRRWIQFDPQYSDNSDQSSMLKAVRFIIERPLHVILVSLLKFFYLVSGVRPFYSTLHNVATVTGMILIYAGAVIGAKSIAYSKLRTVLFTVITGNCLLVMMTTADWDNRFYIPMEAAVVILSAVGWSKIFEKAFQVKTSDL
ncbi:glycosyltransferase family 39 protein [Chryseolinea sp. T2]|uniref:glycosyltransferase family 39 protein n=1 Tax=Chryseolinea sp. T2 TaxID=3129255 RepID=UPI0030779FD2